MLSGITLLALALAAQAAPAPATEAASAKSFSVPAIHNPNHVRNGTAALLKAYAKFGLTPTRELPAAFHHALQNRQDSSAPATDEQNIEYLVPVTIGGQKLNLDFDTGSSDLWVFSTLLPKSSQTGHNIYSTAKSTTYKPKSGYTWSIQYADGSGASGTVVTDTVVVGGTKVTNQAVELANRVSASFVSDVSDGLLGLAFDNINTVRPVAQQTFIGNALSSLQSPLFAAYLPYSANGAYDFGYLDTTKYTGTVSYTPVDSSGGFWEYPSTSYKVGSTVHSQAGITGISDTGTTLILMTDAAVNAYYKAVPSAKYDSAVGGYTFPCSTTLPSLSIAIGSSYATIPGSLLNFGDSGDNSCFGSLQSVGGGTQNIYGDVFFNAYYGVFNLNGPTFGFAPLA